MGCRCSNGCLDCFQYLRIPYEPVCYPRPRSMARLPMEKGPNIHSWPIFRRHRWCSHYLRKLLTRNRHCGRRSWNSHSQDRGNIRILPSMCLLSSLPIFLVLSLPLKVAICAKPHRVLRSVFGYSDVCPRPSGNPRCLKQCTSPWSAPRRGVYPGPRHWYLSWCSDRIRYQSRS
jgi:hypothetical protein